jgi:hypothetical protein
MRIAFVGNFTQRHCSEVHFAATFEALGHEVTRIQENEIVPDQLIDRVKGHNLFFWVRTWEDFVTLSHLKQIKELDIPTVNYHLDLFIGLNRGTDYLLETDPRWRCDYTFTPDGDPASQAIFEAKGINHIYMKPGVYEPECTIYGEQHPELDVIFVGGGTPTGEEPQYGHAEWPYRGQLLKFLRDTYGARFKKFGWPQETIRNEDLNLLYYNASKVVVGDSLCLNFNHPYYWSDRVYETLGRGGFIIHPYIKGLEEEFTEGETIVFYDYNNWDQLREKIDYYLEHDEERERIRLAGHEFVKNNATYTQRLTQMLDHIFPKESGLIFYDESSTISDKDIDLINKIMAPPVKIHLGAGTEILDGYINTDVVDLPGVDDVFNVMNFPWPYGDNSADEIKAKDLIEHLPTHTHEYDNTLTKFIEEAHRILKPGGLLWIQTPSWDADFLWIDYTHVRGYDIRSMDFFDPETDFGRATGFYSEAKFKVNATRLENGNLQFELVKR